MPDLNATWPGRSQREPRRSQPGWSVRQPLVDWLREEGTRAEGKRILDVGCGDKPYYPFFNTAADYTGLDVQQNPNADLHGAAEAIPAPDDAFDLVICTQVLEHADDPALAVREMHRVTAPGGRILLSTHGTQVYHPNPGDYWRWTHTGLERLFRANGDWERVDVQPNAGTTSALAMLVARSLHLLAKRAGIAWAARPFVYVLNSSAAAIDAHVPSLREKRPGALFANLQVTAVKRSATEPAPPSS
ncbi:MAG TPA: class I SAM-dependent methyltransferase [Gaiellaceae bacterium]